AYLAHPIVIEPSTGSSETPALEANDLAISRINPVESFRTSFYTVVAPAGALGTFTARAKSRSFEDAYANGYGTLSVYTKVGNATFMIAPQGSGDRTTLDDTGHLGDQTPPGQITYLTGRPFQPYWIEFQRHNLASDAVVTADFDVPVSGTPDLVV